MWDLPLSLWRISRSVMVSRSIRAAANGIVLPFLMAEQHPVALLYTHHTFFIHLPVDGHLDCFHVLAVVNSAAVNIRVHVSFWITGFFSKYMPRSGIAGSYGNFIFSFLRNCHTVFHKSRFRLETSKQSWLLPAGHWSTWPQCSNICTIKWGQQLSERSLLLWIHVILKLINAELKLFSLIKLLS